MGNKILNQKKARFRIGIDPGTDTGFAVWDTAVQQFEGEICSLKIWQVFEELGKWVDGDLAFSVRIEDANLYKIPPREDSQPRARNAAIVQWYSRQLILFCESLGIQYEAVKPNPRLTKWDAEYFKMVTKYEGRTNNHGRDAALLVYGMR